MEGINALKDEINELKREVQSAQEDQIKIVKHVLKKATDAVLAKAKILPLRNILNQKLKFHQISRNISTKN